MLAVRKRQKEQQAIVARKRQKQDRSTQLCKTTRQTEKRRYSSNTSQHPESSPFRSLTNFVLSVAYPGQAENSGRNVDAAFSATTIRVLQTKKK